MKLTEQERQNLIAEIEAIEVDTELSKGVVTIKFADAWKKFGPLVMMLGNWPRLRPYSEAFVAGINRLIEADKEDEEGEV